MRAFRMLIGATVALALGCQGQIHTSLEEGGSQKIATYALKADSYGALQFAECLVKKGARETCQRYPNPMQCAKLDVSVDAEANVQAVCATADGSKAEKVKGMIQGVPFACKKGKTKGCVACKDLFGNDLISTCPQEFAADSNAAANAAAEQAQPLAADEPIGTEISDCSSKGALQVFAAELNKILAEQGIGFKYQPTTLNPSRALDGFLPGNVLGGCKGNIWTEAQKTFGQFLPGPVCSTSFGGVKVCRCPVMTIQAMEKSCEILGKACKSGAWEVSLFTEALLSAHSLSLPAYANYSVDDSGPSTGGIPGIPGMSSTGPSSSGSQVIPQGGDIESTPPICVGDPLVLDLDGNGSIQTTGLSHGVQFDLLGRGKLQTAWIGDGDAFLALDRNGNGLVDGGNELFGEALGIDGNLTLSGFQALSLLDKPKHGGNGDGVVNAKDALFERLLVWTDRNTDGFSQPDELHTLTDSGIQELSLSYQYEMNSYDRNGNDLGQRGSFIRKDGKPGLMIDVYLIFTSALDHLVSSAF